MENVLLVTVDSLRADHVGYHGYERDTTPFIDGLARQGHRFTNAFAPVGETRCAFPAILASVTPLMYGGYERVAERQTLVAEAFRDAGYRTGGVHSNLYLSAAFGYDRGFDVFYDSSTDPSLTSRLRTFARKNLRGTVVYPLLQRAYDFVESSQGINVGSFHVPADELTDVAVDYVESATSDRPQFLWVHYMDIHHPYLPPPAYQRRFRDDPVDDRRAVQLRRKLLDEPDAVTDAELATVLDLYDAEIRFVDDEIERLVETARQAWDDLTVLLTADHGEHFLERGYFSDANPYDVKLHVPLLVAGTDTSGTHDDLVGLGDVPPTLLDRAGLAIPDQYQGASLCRLVDDSDWPRTAVVGGWGTTERRFVYRTREWKFVERPGDRPDELYDLAADPGERTNVVEDHPERARAFRRNLDDHREAIRATDTDVDEVTVTPAAAKRLRRLGYRE